MKELSVCISEFYCPYSHVENSIQYSHHYSNPYEQWRYLDYFVSSSSVELFQNYGVILWNYSK